MAQLGWYVRQVRTQTVWLTATLPPAIQEELIEQNKLRPNLQYIVTQQEGPGPLLEKAVELVQLCRLESDLFQNPAQDKIIL